MQRFLLLLTAICVTHMACAQTDSLTKEERLALDSMFRSDEFVKLMTGTRKPKSYLDINIGAGNGIFSLKNNSLNAGQAITNKVFYTPSVSYYHKSGFTLTGTGFIAEDEGKLSVYRYAISPAYIYNSKKINFGISYTRFIEGTATNFEVSPYKNDLYASIMYKKTWVQPGIAIGFSAGKVEDYYDTAFWFFNTVVHIRDTITTRLYGFSAILSATHQWNFYKLLGKKDALRLQPVVMLNAGSQRWNISHSSTLARRRLIVQNYLKRRFGDGSSSDSFKVQSLGLLTEATYYYGKFYLQPQLYLDYYLPSTTEDRLTALFSVTAGFSF